MPTLSGLFFKKFINMDTKYQKNRDFYVVGGTMPPDAPSYIERKADRELYENIMVGNLCYVLTPRQMGKSSLMVRTALRLKKEGNKTAIIDLTHIGFEQKKTFTNKWYYSIADCIVDQLDIEVMLHEWWEEMDFLSAIHRFNKFLKDVVLANTDEQIVIFLDEIDTTIDLPFADDFFAAIRACYNARGIQTEYKRLIFVLLGVATPPQLIKDKNRTPFNVGYQIELSDFTIREASPLARGLSSNQEHAGAALERILYWTDGHPYLTQKLCSLANIESSLENVDGYIDKMVEEIFFYPFAIYEESNLNFIKNSLIGKYRYSIKLLKLLRRILTGDVVKNESSDRVYKELELSGLILSERNGQLKIRNRIYKRIFNIKWIEDSIPYEFSNFRFFIFASIIFLFIGLAVGYLYFLPQLYINEIYSAIDSGDVPISSYGKLKEISGYEQIADKIYSNFWYRRAIAAKHPNVKNHATLYHLQALRIYNNDKSIEELKHALSNGFQKSEVINIKKIAVLSAKFNSDRSALCINALNNTNQLWEITPKEIMYLPIIKNVYAIALNTDGELLLAGGDSNLARVWLTDIGKTFGKAFEQNGRVLAVHFNQNGKLTAPDCSEKIIRLWQLTKCMPVFKYIKNDEPINIAAFSPDGKILLIGNDKGEIYLRRRDSGDFIGKPLNHAGPVLSVSFSSDGEKLLTCTDKIATLWSVKTGETIGESTPHDNFNNAIFNRDGERIVFTDTEKMIAFDQVKRRVQHVKRTTSKLAASFSPDDDSTLFVISDKWVHRYVVSSSGLKPLSIRRLPGLYTGAYHFSDNSGNKLRVVVQDNKKKNTIKVVNLCFDIPEDQLMEGEADFLMEHWQKKLGLKLNEEDGTIVPIAPKETSNHSPPVKEVPKRNNDSN
jgi:WD40 repeat protein